MIKINKMDNFDFVFINKKINKEEERAFSDFLKQKKKTRGYKKDSTYQKMMKIKINTGKVETI